MQRRVLVILLEASLSARRCSVGVIMRWIGWNRNTDRLIVEAALDVENRNRVVWIACSRRKESCAKELEVDMGILKSERGWETYCVTKRADSIMNDASRARW